MTVTAGMYSREWWKERISLITAFAEGADVSFSIENSTIIGNAIKFDNPVSDYKIVKKTWYRVGICKDDSLIIACEGGIREDYIEYSSCFDRWLTNRIEIHV